MPSSVFATASLVAALGCGTTEPGVTLNVAGRYEGYWSITVLDTVKSCLVGFHMYYDGDSCGYPVVQEISCRAIVNLTQQGDQFTGTVALDSIAYLPCQAMTTPWLRPAGFWEARNGRIVSLKATPDGRVVGDVRFTIGSGGALEFERLVGCKLPENLEDWSMNGVIGGPGTLAESSRGTGFGAAARGFTQEQYQFRSKCPDRVWNIQLYFQGFQHP